MASETPRALRRRRDIDDEEGSNTPPAEDDTREPPQKRLRPSLDPSDAGSERASEDVDDTATLREDTIEDVLPDSYRRSPKYNRTQMLENGSTTAHQPGSIVRVSLENFVTYSKSEFWPGPHLNMIIGPNGTGKSTLVCAICLGLGWSPKHLGRAKHISEFVKHGSKIAKIEIELAGDPARHNTNQIIRTRITRDSETPDFYINGSKCPKKHVQALARSFAIQVDNLCQFLPQDRVAEFATLSPVRLLEETQRAAAPEYMSQWHASLIELGKEQTDQVAEQQRTMEQLKSLDARQRAQQTDVERLRQRSVLQTRISILEKIKVYPNYRAAKARYLDVKQQVRTATRERNRLQQALEPRERAVQAKKEYISQVDKVIQSRKTVVNRHENAVNNKLTRCTDSEKDMAVHKTERRGQSDGVKEARKQKAKLAHDIQKLQRDMEIEPPSFDPASMNVEIRDKTRQIRELEDQQAEVHERLRTMREQRNQKKNMIEQLESRKERMQSQLGQQASRLTAVSKGAGEAWEWIQDNRDKFQGSVYGPPMIECSIKDKAFVSAFESAVGPSSLLSFTTTTNEDFEMLQQKFYGELQLKAIIYNAPQSTTGRRPLCSDEEVHRLGLDGWLVDLVDGPAAVIATLCDNNSIDSIAYSKRELSVAQNQTIANSPISHWVTPKESSQITRRREYGNHAEATSVRSFRPPQFFTTTPVNRDAEDNVNSEMRHLQMDCEQLAAEISSELSGVTSLDDQLRALKAERTALINEKDAKQKAQKLFEALPTRLEGEQNKLTVCEEKIVQLENEIKGFESKANELQLVHAQTVIDYANAIQDGRAIYMQMIEAEIVKIEATSDLEQLNAQDREERKQLEEAESQLQELGTQKDALYAEATKLGRECKRLHEAASEEEHAVINETSDYTVEQMQVEIESTNAQLEMHAGGNMNILREFEERARKIEQKQAQLETSRQSLDELRAKIKDTRDRWEPELDEIVSRISSAFTENFAAISCAGEVSVYKDDDEFDKWAIQIKVKFRDTEALSILDSHRQSGGERSVSTIFYLMALQSLARAPFRVVDEINQGMDPRNERMVHSRLVSIACEARREDGGGGSQYFLITPKLLTGLEYHENMKIHCIASGEWMPDDQSSLNFSAFAQRALAIRAG